MTCHVSYGQARKWGVWNCYNRVPIKLIAGDATTSWTISSGTSYRISNNDSDNYAHAFCGLSDVLVEAFFRQKAGHNAEGGSGDRGLTIAVGVNSTSAASGRVADISVYASGGTIYQPFSAEHSLYSLGINAINSLEKRENGTITFYGGQDDMILSVRWAG